METSADDDDVVSTLPSDTVDSSLNNEIAGDDDEEDAETPSVRLLNALTRESAVTKFDRHQGAVFTVDCHADLIVSGGEDDKAFLWDAENGRVIAEFSEGFEDSISHVGFNSNGSLLFVADLVGHIQFYKVSAASSSTEKCFEADVGAELRCAEWHRAPGSNVFLCGTASGQCWIHRIPQGDCKVFQTASAVTCFVQIGADGKKMMLGSESGAVTFLDLKTMSADFEIQPPSGASSRRVDDAEAVEITCIAATLDGAVCAAGTADGEVKLISIAKKQVFWTIQDLLFTGKSQQRTDATKTNGGTITEGNGDISMQDAEAEQFADENLSIEAVQFGNQPSAGSSAAQTSPWLAVASIRGVVCIFDVKAKTRRHVLQLSNIAFTQMLWPQRDSSNSNSYLGDVDGHVVSVDSRTGELNKRFVGPEGTVLGLSCSNNNKWLAAASDDGNVYVYRT